MGDDFDDSEYGDSPKGRIDELESRIDELESGTAEGVGSIGVLFFLAGFYFFGVVLAMILSWSRNASILYCIWHGCMSWAYVVYFALAR
jgi:hypothetical protein